MTESIQASFTPQELAQLQRLHAKVLALQNTIAELPADEQNEARNEQFNQLRLEAKALLKDGNFDKKVNKAITQADLTERQQLLFPRLSGIVMFGVILALLGLGVNSIILDDLIINSSACLVSSGGMALVVGAFVVWMWTKSRQRLSNLGELYLNCNALLSEISHVLSLAIPGLAERSPAVLPETPSVINLLLDSLQKQASDWQLKLRNLEEQRFSLGSDVPPEFKLNEDFVQRELSRVQQEIDRLNELIEASSDQAVEAGAAPKIVIPPGAYQPPDADTIKRARSMTLDMPANRPEE